MLRCYHHSSHCSCSPISSDQRRTAQAPKPSQATSTASLPVWADKTHTFVDIYCYYSVLKLIFTYRHMDGKMLRRPDEWAAGWFTGALSVTSDRTNWTRTLIKINAIRGSTLIIDRLTKCHVKRFDCHLEVWCVLWRSTDRVNISRKSYVDSWRYKISSMTFDDRNPILK